MKKLLLFPLVFIVLVAVVYYFMSQPKKRATKISNPTISYYYNSAPDRTLIRTKTQAAILESYASQHGCSTQYCFLIDMNIPSGKKRFFVYDIQKDTIVAAGLVAHGSCNKDFLREASFSNTPGCGCSSVGKFKVGYPYKGRFGSSFKLFGLDSTNSNAYERNVVLHPYDCVPDSESYPYPICNSLGCPMVSYKFLNQLSEMITQSKKPILLWIYN